MLRRRSRRRRVGTYSSMASWEPNSKTNNGSRFVLDRPTVVIPGATQLIASNEHTRHGALDMWAGSIGGVAVAMQRCYAQNCPSCLRAAIVDCRYKKPDAHRLFTTRLLPPSLFLRTSQSPFSPCPTSSAKLEPLPIRSPAPPAPTVLDISLSS